METFTANDPWKVTTPGLSQRDHWTCDIISGTSRIEVSADTKEEVDAIRSGIIEFLKNAEISVIDAVYEKTLFYGSLTDEAHEIFSKKDEL